MRTIKLKLTDDQAEAIGRVLVAIENENGYSDKDWQECRAVLMDAADRLPFTIYDASGKILEQGKSIARKVWEKAERIARNNGVSVDDLFDFLVRWEFKRLHRG